MFEIASLGLGLIGNIGKMFSRGRANREMDKLIKQNPVYTENPIARQRVGLAQTLLNARMPGAAAAQRNIYSNQANQLSSVDRNATDASQALAAKAGIGANTNNSFMDLGQQEAADYQRRYSNMTSAQEGLLNEQKDVFGDGVRRFGDLTQFRGAQAANRAANWGDTSNMGFGLADFGASGGFANFFNKNQRGTGGRLGGMFGGAAGG